MKHAIIVTGGKQYRVAEGDVISIRKVGKFLIDSAVDRSKKNRIILKYRKYS